MDSANITIIIATMNRPQSLKDTFYYLERSTVLPNEIIVVDQSPDIGMQRSVQNLLKTSSFNTRYFYRTPSLTAARNFGIRQATNDIVVFMDDDVRVQPDTIEKILKCMADSKISMIGGLSIVPSVTNNIWGYVFAKKSFRNRNIGHVTGAIFGRYPSHVIEQVATTFAMGYFFVIRKPLVEQWKLKWDERLISYGYPEDLDFSFHYCFHSAFNGYRCILDPRIIVHHMNSDEWRETPWNTTLMYVINREYLSYKWQLNWLSRVKTRWANFGIFLERLIHRDHCLDVLKAQFYCDLYRKDIKNGNLHTELYDSK